MLAKMLTKKEASSILQIFCEAFSFCQQIRRPPILPAYFAICQHIWFIIGRSGAALMTMAVIIYVLLVSLAFANNQLLPQTSLKYFSFSSIFWS
jgi:hypothetical protein